MEIDLDLLEEKLARTFSTTRTNFVRVKPKSIILENKPILIKTDSIETEIEGRIFKFGVSARIYDIGAFSICFIYENSDGNYCDLEETALHLANGDPLSGLFSEYVNLIGGSLKPLIKDFTYDPDFYEDYTIYVTDTAEITGDPVILLMGERAEFSAQMREEVTKNTQSYTKDDLAILSWDSALLCSPENPQDLIDLIEFANVQVLELRYYDMELNRQMEKMYDDINHADRLPNFLKTRQYHLIMTQLMERNAEISEVIEKVRNLIKITGDVYYVRVYETALRVIRSSQWTESVSRKTEMIQENYSMLSDEVRIQHSNFLEWIVIILIAMELGLGVWHYLL
ncbi:hypothetical protein [Methanoplanus endosymbiosus]|uniref:DUF155 domain-containing protein n=1 Tax=Methanoplanus endosymbiosus TaxID=33865 RepID=A0A9E7PL11_9EURY|nr:hypothetical protein [Methanoplanus endosymbiosus]UUX92058.1 hypothetical protein L6E24_11940 [Methanoplanus endosymbiosus]